MIQFKQGVNPLKVHPAVWMAIGICYNIRRRYTSSPLIITSLNDGGHGTGSLHYPHNSPDGLCRAADLRTHDISEPARYAWAREVKLALEELGFDIVHHDGSDKVPLHLHIEFDPKNGEDYWINFKMEAQT